MLESYLCSDVIISIPRHEDVLQSCNLAAVGRSVTGTASGSKMIQITRVWLEVGFGILELEHDERKKKQAEAVSRTQDLHITHLKYECSAFTTWPLRPTLTRHI